MKRPERLWVAAPLLAAAGLALFLPRPDSSPPAGPPAAPAAVAPSTAGPSVQPPIQSAAPSTDGLRLFGLLGAGAVFGLRDGRQRWVAAGREVLPGLRLEEVRQTEAILVSSAGRIRLAFGDAPAQAVSEPASAAVSPSAVREDHLRYRLGFEPHRVDGRVAGFVIRRQADLPMLRRAGLQAGDVILSVNGQSFDSEEKVQELASEIAGSFAAEFEFVRGGRRMRRSVQVNPRTAQ